MGEKFQPVIVVVREAAGVGTVADGWVDGGMDGWKDG